MKTYSKPKIDVAIFGGEIGAAAEAISISNGTAPALGSYEGKADAVGRIPYSTLKEKTSVILTFE